MVVEREQLDEIAASVFDSMLEMTVTSADVGELSGRQLTGSVHITGGWSGSVTVRAGHELASRVAAAMFMMEPGEASDEDVRDAFGELANMVGGNVKGMMPNSEALSLPVVTDGLDAVSCIPGAQLVTEAHYESDAGHFVVSVYTAPKKTAEPHTDAIDRHCETCGQSTPHRTLKQTIEEDRFADVVIAATVQLFQCLECQVVEPEIALRVSDSLAPSTHERANGKPPQADVAPAGSP